jgi:hypothetical protein
LKDLGLDTAQAVGAEYVQIADPPA